MHKKLDLFTTLFIRMLSAEFRLSYFNRTGVAGGFVCEVPFTHRGAAECFMETERTLTALKQ